MDHELGGQHDTARHTLHRVANHVLARAEHAVNAHVGLRATPGGFSTTTTGAGTSAAGTDRAESGSTP